MQCPNCNNTLEFLIEKSPFGITECCRCTYKAEHRVFNQDVVAPDRTTNITNSALGLKIAGKNEDYISIALNAETITTIKFSNTFYVFTEAAVKVITSKDEFKNIVFDEINE